MLKLDGKNNGTLWLEEKDRKVFKGDRKGETYQCFEGTIDTGGGKMITIKMYSNTDPVDKDGKTLLPLKVSKWKGNPSRRKTTRKSW